METSQKKPWKRQPAPIGFTALKQWLRHRHPMILIDRILDHEPGAFLIAISAVAGSLDVFTGHFPERAVYPGTQLIQAVSQCGIILFQMSSSPLAENELTVVGSVEARFFRVVVPGDTVVFNVRVDRLVRNAFYFTANATVNSKRVAAFRASLARVGVSQIESPLW